MRIAMFGLGYAGCVSAACLARRGRNVVRVDVNPRKMDMDNGGHPPVVDPGPEVIRTHI